MPHLLMLPDPAADETDRILADLEERIHKEYKQALKEAEKKWTDYLAAFDAQDKVEAAKLANGEITEQEYQAWRTRHIAQGKHWEDMRNVIAQDYHNRNVIAAKLANDTMPDVYAVNANYGTYMVEHSGRIDTGFTLYNHDSAEALLKKEWSINPETGRNSFLPPPKPGGKRARELAGLRETNPDLLWNARNIQSAMMQGVLTGEPITELAKRLAGVARMDEHQAIRNARTLTTNVQNKGRMDSFDRAKKLGVELVDEWTAILDGRTRHSHRHMHGERKDHDSEEPFSNGCRWPGDPWGEPAEVYNCRCRVISWVKGFEGDTVKHNDAMGDMSFEEWQNANAPKQRNSDLTSGADHGNMSARVSDQNTGKHVFYSPENDYSIHVDKYSEAVNKMLSSEAKWLAKKGTEDNVEWLSLVDLDTGERLYREPGDLMQTGMEFWDVVNNNETRQIAFIHNHCLDGSLSSPDMEVMLQADNIRCMIAVRNDGVKYVAPRNSAPTPYKFLFQLYGDKPEDDLVKLAIKDYTEGYYEHDGRK